MPLYLHTEHGLTLAIFSTALHCYAWILFQAGSPNQIIEWDETVGRHGFEQAVREGRDEMAYQARERDILYNGETPHAHLARHTVHTHNTEFERPDTGRSLELP